MATTVNLPLLGATNRNVAVAVIGGGILVSGYMIYKTEKSKKQAAAAAAAAASKSNASGYGYGYGSQTPYGASSGYGYGAYGEFSAYPQEEVYGYGAYGYGYYNPDTGQYYGSGTGSVGTGTAGNTTPATNAQWEQDVASILSGEGYTPQSIQQALGDYLQGNYQNWNAQDQTILNAAIGAAGEPPDPPTANPPGVGTSTSTSGSITVPNVVGQSIDNAGLVLSGAGLKLKVTSPKTRNHSFTYRILTQSPKAGASAASGATVSVTAQKVGKA
jgi:PASTA domain